MWVWVGLAPALGAAASSFLQLVLDLAAAGVPAARWGERSRCPRCTTVLRSRDTLPVLGFAVRRGRRRVCAGVIPSRHVRGELAGAAAWGMAGTALGLHSWLPAVFVAPAFVVLLLTARVRRRRRLAPGRVATGRGRRPGRCMPAAAHWRLWRCAPGCCWPGHAGCGTGAPGPDL